MTLRKVDGDVGVIYKDDGSWTEGTFNPDHNLAVIHAANKDFESKMNSQIGSYLIHLWTRMVTQNVDGTWCKCRGKWYLGEIMNEIQRVLEVKGKQLVVSVFTNGSERIVFGRKTSDSADDSSRAASTVKV